MVLSRGQRFARQAPEAAAAVGVDRGAHVVGRGGPQGRREAAAAAGAVAVAHVERVAGIEAALCDGDADDPGVATAAAVEVRAGALDVLGVDAVEARRRHLAAGGLLLLHLAAQRHAVARGTGGDVERLGGPGGLESAAGVAQPLVPGAGQLDLEGAAGGDAGGAGGVPDGPGAPLADDAPCGSDRQVAESCLVGCATARFVHGGMVRTRPASPVLTGGVRGSTT
jgi:hypothetical protein